MEKLLLIKASIQRGIFTFFVLSMFCNCYAQPFSAAYSWSGTIACPTSSGTIPTTVTGLTFTQFARGSVNCNSTSAALRSSNWLLGDSSAAIAGNKYITFSVSANATTSFVITSVVLRLLINSTSNGNGGPKNAKLKYTTASAYSSFGDIISLTATAADYTFTPTQAIVLAAGQTLTFRLYGYNSGSNGAGTLDITAATINGQSNLGQYRSKTSGNWNNVTSGSSSWEMSGGTTWTEALVAPNNNSGAITIQNSHTMTVTTSVIADELVINSGGKLTVNSGQTLTIANGAGMDLTNNGILDVQGEVSGVGASSGFGSAAELYTNNTAGVNGVFSSFATVAFSASNNNSFTFNSTGNQITGTLMPAVIKNITVANGGTKTLSQKTIVSPAGVVTLTGATFDLNNDSLILQSTSTGTARVDKITGGGAFVNAGKFTMQRFVPSGSGRFWWHLSSPVNGASVAQWQDDFYVTGVFSNPSSASGINSNGVSAHYYDETVAGDLNLGWINYPASGNSSASLLVSGRGYRAFIRDNNGLSSDKTIDVTGTPITGTLNFNVTMSGVVLINDGWNLIGNPYPSDIDWSNAGWTKTNMDNAVYVWNAASQSYSSFIGGIGTNGGTGRVASSQAFWVKANGANPVLIATENVKTSTSTIFTKNAAVDNLLRIALTDNVANDEIVIRFDETSSNEYDSELDAYSLSAARLGLASICNDSVGLSINSLPEFTDDLEVKLNSYYSVNGSYSLVFNSLETFTEDISIYLIDKYLDSLIQVQNGMFYDFDVTADAATKEKDRFAIVFKRSKITSVLQTASVPDFLIYPNPLDGNYFNIRLTNVNGGETTIILYDVLGKEIVNEKLSNSSVAQIKFDENLPGGLYLVQCIVNGQKITKNLVIR